MLKMILVDDERIIRETIASFIDWSSLDIKIIGLYSNGIDAFNVILDEDPDIVLTDIKMPGLSGIELIEKAKNIDAAAEFVILSGYNEFEFAKSAMKYGVKHYLLKPCSEKEILDVIHSCIHDYQKNILLQLENLSKILMTQLEDFQSSLWQSNFEKFILLLENASDLNTAKTFLIKLFLKVYNVSFFSLSEDQLHLHLNAISRCEDKKHLTPTIEYMKNTLFSLNTTTKYMDCIEKLLHYINIHLSDSNLSLKWISENHLYMNADYISKLFLQQTGCKFSAYVTNARIEKAKILLLDKTLDSPYEIAEKVGFGNNPQYFSQIFKKYTNMTPSQYRKMN